MRRLFSFHDRVQLLSKIVFGAGVLVASLLTSASSDAGTVTFGSGANAFNMEFVTIGNPGNAADTNGIGAVRYTYDIGKFEVSQSMIDKFNASQAIQISHAFFGPNKPAGGVSWNEAARFVNWLNTSTDGFAAYKFTTNNANDNIDVWTSSDTLDYNPLNPYRSKRATYVLPSDDEWYKAGFYNSATRAYHLYATSDGSAPTAVLSGTGDKTAVFGQAPSPSTLPADIDNAGGLSAYGVMAIGGNLHEWNETSSDRSNSSGTLTRGQVGGNLFTSLASLQANSRPYLQPHLEGLNIGFRVARVSSSGGGGGGEVPEPTSMAIFGLGALAMACRAKRKNKA